MEISTERPRKIRPSDHEKFRPSDHEKFDQATTTSFDHNEFRPGDHQRFCPLDLPKCCPSDSLKFPLDACLSFVKGQKASYCARSERISSAGHDRLCMSGRSHDSFADTCQAHNSSVSITLSHGEASCKEPSVMYPTHSSYGRLLRSMLCPQTDTGPTSPHHPPSRNPRVAQATSETCGLAALQEHTADDINGHRISQG